MAVKTYVKINKLLSARFMSDNRRIAKNTMFLYFRMILIMGVTLYMSRVVLDKLGVDDFGLYNVVGGVVGMLSFVNGTLGIGTSRFLTYELGRNDEGRLNLTFNTAFYTHLALALILTLVLETGGLWYVYNKMVVPESRLDAALIAYHMSVLTSFVSIIQVPYTAMIMAYERMGAYAYISIFEAFAKLSVVFLLSISPHDRLVVYAIMLGAVQILVALLYCIYCRRHFITSKLRLLFDKKIFKEMLGFSGWNIMANISETLNLQGIVVLINLFFAPYVVAAQAVANQVSGAMMLFVNNFRNAINPLIIKLYASGERDDSKQLTLDTTVYCFDLVLMLGLPAIILMDKIMALWLVEVPDYAIVFTQWIIVRLIIGTFSASFYIPMMAANRLRVNSIASVFSGIGVFVLLFFLFKMGCGPLWIQYIGLISGIIFSFVIKPYVLYKDVDYKVSELLKCYWTCFKVAALSCLISLPFAFLLGDAITDSLIKALVAFIAVVFSSYVMMNKDTREIVLKYIVSKLRCSHK